MRQTARIDRAAAEDEAGKGLTSKSRYGAAESGAGARRVLAFGLVGAGAVVGIAAPAVSAAVTAAPEPDAVEAAPMAGGAVAQAHLADWSRFGQVKLYPLAGTGVDPLSNVIGTNLSGLPISTAPVNAVFSDGLPLRDLPMVGAVLSPLAAAPAPAAVPAPAAAVPAVVAPDAAATGSNAAALAAADAPANAAPANVTADVAAVAANAKEPAAS